MVKKFEKQMDISLEAKSKLKDIYKDVIFNEISQQLISQHKDSMIAVEDSIKGKVLNAEIDKKQNKKILAKLEEILIRMALLEEKEEEELQVLAKNSKELMIANIVLLLIVGILILVKM